MRKSNSELLDEIARAAIRCVDEALRGVAPLSHDGTDMVLMPEIIFRRLEDAVKELVSSGEYGPGDRYTE